MFFFRDEVFPEFRPEEGFLLVHSDDDLVWFDHHLTFLVDENGVPQSVDPESVILHSNIQDFEIKVVQTKFCH